MLPKRELPKGDAAKRGAAFLQGSPHYILHVLYRRVYVNRYYYYYLNTAQWNIFSRVGKFE